MSQAKANGRDGVGSGKGEAKREREREVKREREKCESAGQYLPPLRGTGLQLFHGKRQSFRNHSERSFQLNTEKLRITTKKSHVCYFENKNCASGVKGVP